MLWTINFLVLQEDTMALACAHEVVVAGAGGEAATNCGPWLLTLLTALDKKKIQVTTGFECKSVKQINT